MEELTIKSQLRIGSYIVTKMKDDSFVFVTFPTEQNNGGVVLAIYNPFSDMNTYPFIEQQYRMATEENNEFAKTALHMRCSALYALKGENILDPQFVNRLIDEIQVMRIRVKSLMDKQPVETPSEQTDEDWNKEQDALDSAKERAEAQDTNTNN